MVGALESAGFVGVSGIVPEGVGPPEFWFRHGTLNWWFGFHPLLLPHDTTPLAHRLSDARSQVVRFGLEFRGLVRGGIS
jgi:hypothetical protein